MESVARILEGRRILAVALADHGPKLVAVLHWSRPGVSMPQGWFQVGDRGHRPPAPDPRRGLTQFVSGLERLGGGNGNRRLGDITNLDGIGDARQFRQAHDSDKLPCFGHR